MDKIVNSRRTVYIDFLRIVAIFLVLFNHTQADGFTLFTRRLDSPLFSFYLFCSLFCKIAVPIYFMISGALLLHKEETFADVLKKRFLKYLIVLLFASLSVYILRNYKSGLSASFFLTKVYSSTMYTALWFLYAYLGYILMLPLLRKLVKTMEEKDYFWLMGMACLFSVIRILQFLLFRGTISYNTTFDVPLITNTIFFPLLGYYLAHKVDVQKLDKKTILLCFAFSFAAICISGFVTCEWCAHIGEWKEATCQKFINELIFVPAATIFLTAKYFFSARTVNPKVEKVIASVGSATFGIYLFETVYRQVTEIVFTTLNGYLPTFIACMAWVSCAFLLGYIVTCLLKRIPIVRDYI